jgi:3-oxoacyl-[acyl-carrier-protein] synthase III
MKIIGVGHYVPRKIITNSDLECKVRTSDEWIVSNTGIAERRVVEQERTSDLAAQAGLRAILDSGLEKKQIRLVIVATATPDKLAPSTACIVKDRLELKNAAAFDINAVCSGFIYGLRIAQGFDNVLLIGADVFSWITNWERRDCVFFGDGAGAVVLKRKRGGITAIEIASESEDGDAFLCDHGSTFIMDTKKVYQNAITLMPKIINRVLEKAKMSISDIDWMVPHQPSIRVLFEVADRIGIKRSKVLMNMNKYANTSAGTIPILLSELWSKFKPGEKILFAAIGSGWTYGAAIYEV